jgi:hypothetical protein
MKKQLLNLFLAAVCVSAVSILRAQYSPPEMVVEIPAVETEADIPAIDAAGDDAAYSNYVAMTLAKEAGAAMFDYDPDGNAPDFDSKFKVCWDATYLYLYVNVVDDNLDFYHNGYGQAWT